MSEAQRVKVKRDGPRGWHWIAAAHYDPVVHEIVQDDPTPAPASPPAPAAPATPPPNPAPRRASPKSKAAARG